MMVGVDRAGDELPRYALARLGTVRLRHAIASAHAGHCTASVYDVAISPCGKFIASASDERTVRLWDVSTGREIQRYLGHAEPVNAVGFSRSGSELFSISQFERVLAIWDTMSGKCLHRITEPDGCPFFKMCLSPDGTTLATTIGAAPPLLRFLDLSTRQFHRELIRDVGNRAICWSPDGSTLAVGTDRIHLIDAQTRVRRATLDGHAAGLNGLVFSSTNTALFSSGIDGYVRRWNLATGALQWQTETGSEWLFALTNTCDDGILVGTKEGNVVSLQQSSGHIRATKRLHGGAVTSVATFGDGTAFVTGSHDATVGVWDSATMASRHSFAAHRGSVSCVVTSSDGQWVATAGGDPGVHLWGTADHALINWWEAHEGCEQIVRQMCFAADQPLLGTFGRYADHFVRLWEVPTGKARTVAKRPSTFSGTGRFTASLGRIAYADGNDVFVWDLRESNPVHLGAHGDNIDCLHMLAKTGRFLSDDSAREIRIWNLDAPERFDSIVRKRGEAHIQSCASSPDDKSLVLGRFDGAIELWDLDRGAEVRSWEAHVGPVKAIAYSPLGRIATGGADRRVRVWDATTNNPIHGFVGHEGEILSLAYSPDGRILYSGSSDNTCLAWRVST